MRLHLGNRILCIFIGTAEISLF